MSRIVAPSKFLGETLTLPFDFTSTLAVGETISTKSVTATVYSGTDATPAAVISGSATSSGTIVSQKITGGALGVIYELLCQITTSAGQTAQQACYLAVVPDLP